MPIPVLLPRAFLLTQAEKGHDSFYSKLSDATRFTAFLIAVLQQSRTTDHHYTGGHQFTLLIGMPHQCLLTPPYQKSLFHPLPSSLLQSRQSQFFHLSVEERPSCSNTLSFMAVPCRISTFSGYFLSCNAQSWTLFSRPLLISAKWSAAVSFLPLCTILVLTLHFLTIQEHF